MLYICNHFSLFNGAVCRRPFAEEFMQFCLERFEVGIWTSARESVFSLRLHSSRFPFVTYFTFLICICFFD